MGLPATVTSEFLPPHSCVGSLASWISLSWSSPFFIGGHILQYIPEKGCIVGKFFETVTLWISLVYHHNQWWFYWVQNSMLRNFFCLEYEGITLFLSAQRNIKPFWFLILYRKIDSHSLSEVVSLKFHEPMSSLVSLIQHWTGLFMGLYNLENPMLQFWVLFFIFL